MIFNSSIKIKELSEVIDVKVDYFICCASFENRCLKIPKQIAKALPSKVILCHNDNTNIAYKRNIQKLKTIFADGHEILELKKNDPVFNVLAFLDFLSTINTDRPTNFILDITTFTHEILLIVFRYLKMKLKKHDHLYCIYLDADDYSINEEKLEDKWLSKGIKEIRSVIGYPGIISPAKKTHLIIPFGFESERTKKIIETFEANVVSLAFVPQKFSVNNKHYELNYIKHKELLHYYPDSFSFEISLFNPLEVKEQIKSQISKFKDCNVIIAPMNNKVSTLGAALLALENSNVQLCYVIPNRYNTSGYSKAGKNCYIFKF